MGAIACVLAGALAGATPAQATRVSVIPPDDAIGLPGAIEIAGTSGPNQISVAYEPVLGTFLITDTSGIATRACERLTPGRVRCLSPSDSRIEIGTREGSDRVQISRSVLTGADVSGGSGTDVIVGGRFDDDLTGDGGDDVISGKAGDDDLGSLFDLGHDEFYGGGGNDDIDASEQGSGPDLVISCGAGKLDDAFVDEDRDPRPNGCEDVTAT